MNRIAIFVLSISIVFRHNIDLMKGGTSGKAIRKEEHIRFCLFCLSIECLLVVSAKKEKSHQRQQVDGKYEKVPPDIHYFWKFRI